MPKYPGRIVSATPPSVSLSGASGVWTLEEVAQYEQAGTWPVGVVSSDPYFKQTVLLLHGDGTNGAQNNTFLDSGTANGGVGFTITRNPATGPNAPTQGTFSPFSLPNGEWSNYFDGTTDWLSVADNAAFTLGASDFTIECWLYSTNTGVRQFFAGQIASTGLNSSASFFLQKSSTNKLVGIVCSGSTSYTATSTNDLPLNAWTHVALVRDGNTLRQYINGVQDGTASVTGITINDSSEILAIGRAGNLAADHWFGYISNFRQVVGTCLYPSGTAFTPSSTPLSNASGTSLLTCQSNRFVDNGTANSGTGFTITRNGDVRVTPFSPFAPSAAYSAGTNGGSGYFDGTGDFLSSPNNSAIHVLGSDFCLEGWFYLETTQSNRGLYSTYANVSGNEFGYFLRLDTTIIRFYYGDGVGTGVSVDRTFTFTQGQWYHFAVTNSGGTGRIFVNGVQQGATFTFVSPSNSTTDLQIGQTHTVTNSFLGYLSSFRVVKGRAVYTSDFTPPTAPLGTTSGGTNPPQGSETSLLLNFTNAGIFDNTGKNNLETVGNAQIDTSVKKFGTGSMEFDGTTDYVVQPTSENYGYGTGDFTIEFWLNLNSTATQTVVSNLTSASSVNPHLYYLTGQGLRYFTNNADRINGSALSTGQWYHVALVRASGSTRLYIDGTQSGSTYTDSNNYGATAPLGIGTYWASGSPVTTNTLNGYIDDLRITKGVARYPTEPFPTAPFPDL